MRANEPEKRNFPVNNNFFVPRCCKTLDRILAQTDDAAIMQDFIEWLEDMCADTGCVMIALKNAGRFELWDYDQLQGSFPTAREMIKWAIRDSEERSEKNARARLLRENSQEIGDLFNGADDIPF